MFCHLTVFFRTDSKNQVKEPGVQNPSRGQRSASCRSRKLSFVVNTLWEISRWRQGEGGELDLLVLKHKHQDNIRVLVFTRSHGGN